MAATNDLITLAEGRSALNQGSQTANNTEITALITAVSVRIDSSGEGVGPVVIRTVTSETHDGRGCTVQLDEWPVDSVTTVTEDGTVLDSDQYLIDKTTGELHRRDGDYDYRWEPGRATVVVTYEAGRVANTAAVGLHYKQGAYLLLKHMWRAEQWNTTGFTGGGEFDTPQVAYPSFGIPNAVTDWFGGKWRGGKGGFS